MLNKPKVAPEDFLAILDKAENGPVVDVNEWDNVYIYAKIKELIEKFDLKFPVAEPGVPADDELADRVFAAAIQLCVDAGVYCTDTHRRMIWTEEEIQTVLDRIPDHLTAGTDDDVFEIRKRLPDSPGKVPFGGGPWGVVIPEEYFLQLSKAYVKEPLFDFFTTGALKTIHGRPIRAGSPWDTAACWHEIRMTIQAIEEAGRPGMAICAPNTSASAIGTVSVHSHGGMRPTDWQNASFMSELKVPYEDLIRTSHFIETNSFVHNFYNPIFGGYAGGVEGTAIATVAGFILMKATLFGDSFNTGVSHAHYSFNTFPSLIVSQAVAMQALSRNCNICAANFTRPAAGPTEMDMMYEIAAYQLATVTSGVWVGQGVQTATGRFEGHCSPLEARFAAEIAHAADGMTRREAHPIVNKLIQKFKGEQKLLKKGKPFNECYDLETLEPTAEWQGVYERARTEMRTLGIPLD
jgi:methylamine---corrinoid protein Co-methyltransferase